MTKASPTSWRVRARAALLWVIGLGILAVLAMRLPFSAFRAAIDRGPHGRLFVVDLLVTTVVLAMDTIATQVGLRVVRIAWSFARVLAIRGATYALFVLNFAVGQGAFGYYLHKLGEKPLRATGITLFLLGTTLASLLVITTAAWATGFAVVPSAQLQWILVIGCVAFAAYLALIRARSQLLARRAVLAPLFDAGLSGHAVAVLARVPYVTALVLGHWVALRTWGIPVPLSTGLALLPIVVVASALPIAPAGLGTTQAAFVLFFARYAIGATPDVRAASVLAFSVIHFAYGAFASLTIGLVCLPFARRTVRLTASAAP